MDSRYQKEIYEKGVSNNKADRSWSDKIDKFMGWEGGYKDESELRAKIHGIYH